MSHSPPPEIRYAAMQHRILALEEQNARLVSKMVKRPIQSYVLQGRAIRRLVSLSYPVVNLIREHDRRVLLADSPDNIEYVDATAKQERMYCAFKKLVQWCPSITELMEAHDADELEHACAELRKGADGARGDDTSNLKRYTAVWLNNENPHPLPLIGNNKSRRGFYHNVTGGLISPVDYDWTDPVVRAAIRKYDQRYPVTAHMWPSFLYANGQYQSNQPSVGLFKGELLVTAFCCIFTSPSSATHEAAAGNGDANEGPHDQQQVHPRANVATLLKMQKVEPRAIAYIAVQLRFALSSRTSWDLQDDNFDYELFYNNMIDWFEKPATQVKAQLITDLLLWWNEKVFGCYLATAAAVNEQDTAAMSVAASMV